MITLDLTNTSINAVGASHGLDLDSAWQTHRDTMGQHVQALWQNPQQKGGWRRWLTISQEFTGLLDEIENYTKTIEGQFEHLVIVGIGGSALGPLAMFEALLPSYWNERTPEQRQRRPKYYFIDNVDPDKLQGLLEVLDLRKTLVNVITKSGTTAETMAGYMWLRTELEKIVGKDAIAKHLVMTTDPEKGILRKIANEEGVKAFEVPEDVGGRFSVFCAVGLLPAAILGINVRDLFNGINDLIPALSNTDLVQNIAAQGALVQYLHYQRGKRISLLMPYSAKLASVADWYVQLWAESLGKAQDLTGATVHEGPTPLKAVGVTDQHSQVQLFNEGPFDKIATFIRLGSFTHNLTIANLYPDNADLNYLGNQPFEKLLQAEGDATRASLTSNQRPNVSLILPQLDAYHFAQLLFFFEVQTALMGALLNVDTFNQPGVELGKQYTYALMGRPGYDHLLAEISGKAPVSV